MSTPSGSRNPGTFFPPERHNTLLPEHNHGSVSVDKKPNDLTGQPTRVINTVEDLLTIL